MIVHLSSETVHIKFPNDSGTDEEHTCSIEVHNDGSMELQGVKHVSTADLKKLATLINRESRVRTVDNMTREVDFDE